MRIIASLLQQHANAYGSKSSILGFWVWLIGLTLTTLIFLAVKGIANWITYGLFIVLLIEIIGALVTYFYCLFANKPDLLRSENFLLQKMVIEKQTIGDSLTGSQEIPAISQNQIITVQDDQE